VVRGWWGIETLKALGALMTLRSGASVVSVQFSMLSGSRGNTQASLAVMETWVYEAAAELPGIMDKELREIQRSLEELG
jgi:hypothetical protein